MLAWVDIETTGLDHMAGVVLEVALIITTDDLEELSAVNVVVKHSEHIRNLAEPQVQSMHDTNGLWQAVAGPASWPIDAAEERLMEAIEPHQGLPMCGSTIGFDRRWLAWHMPKFEAMFHHRSVDISSVKELDKRWNKDGSKYEPASHVKAHRAINDVRESIAEAKHYKATRWGDS